MVKDGFDQSSHDFQYLPALSINNVLGKVNVLSIKQVTTFTYKGDYHQLVKIPE